MFDLVTCAPTPETITSYKVFVVDGKDRVFKNRSEADDFILKHKMRQVHKDLNKIGVKRDKHLYLVYGGELSRSKRYSGVLIYNHKCVGEISVESDGQCRNYFCATDWAMHEDIKTEEFLAHFRDKYEPIFNSSFWDRSCYFTHRWGRIDDGLVFLLYNAHHWKDENIKVIKLL